MRILKTKWYVVLRTTKHTIEIWAGPFDRKKDIWSAEYEKRFGQDWMRGSQVLIKNEVGMYGLVEKRDVNLVEKRDVDRQTV